MRLLAALMLLWSVDAHAIIIIGGTGAAPDPPPADTCTTQSEDVSLTVNNATSTFYTTNTERGQSWKAGVTGKLYSVTLYRNAASGDDSGATSGLDLRIGTSTDMSTTYLVEFTCTVGSSNPGAKECVIPEADRPTLTSGTTYYLAMKIGNGYTTPWNLARDSGNSYADGTSYYDTSENWILATSYTSDLYLVTKMCD